MGNLIQVTRFYWNLARKTKHPYFILQLRLYSHYIRRFFLSARDRCGTIIAQPSIIAMQKNSGENRGAFFSSFSPSVEGILRNGIPITSPTEMGNIAMKFYQEQFTQHKNNQSSIEIEAELIDQKLNQELQTIHPDHNFYVKFHDLKRIISCLKNNNPAGLDGVSNQIIKLLPSNRLVFITTTFNYMIQNLKYLQHWHTAEMVIPTLVESKNVET